MRTDHGPEWSGRSQEAKSILVKNCIFLTLILKVNRVNDQLKLYLTKDKFYLIVVPELTTTIECNHYFGVPFSIFIT